MLTASPGRSVAVKLISSRMCSRMVCRRRAPMFSTFWLTSAAMAAISSMASSAKTNVTPSVSRRATYCLIREVSGSSRMRLKSSAPRAESSTRIGRRPCNSGSRSDGLARWKAPEAINSTWSVFTAPYLVATVVPSNRGSRSRCTPSRLTSPPERSERVVTLSISSRKTIPFSSTAVRASRTTVSSSSSLSDSSATRTS